MAISTKSKPPSHYKKRIGKHHKKSKHYMKAYWPYLPISTIVGLGVFVNSLLPGAGAVLGANTDLSGTSLLSSTNQRREAANEQALNLNSQLTAAAQAKANDMVARNYWSHDTPDGKQPWSFITSAGYDYQAAGENLAYGFTSASAVLSGWMNSAEHRSNILDANYRDVGFGVAGSPNFHGSGPEVIVVAMYAEPVSASPVNISFEVKQTNPATNVLGSSVSPPPQAISRVALLTSGTYWSLTSVILLTSMAAFIFVYRHWRAWHRVLVKSEAFVVTHPWFDILLVTCGTIGVLLTRVTGFTL